MTRPPTTSSPDVARLADEAARGCVVPVDAACVLGRAWQEAQGRIAALQRTIEQDHRIKVALEAEANDLEARLDEAERERDAARARLAAIDEHRDALGELLGDAEERLDRVRGETDDPAAWEADVAALRAVLGVVDA